MLDEFVLTVYLPQLEEKVADLFHDAVRRPRGVQPDPLSRRLSVQPLAKASTQLMALVNSLCAMLGDEPVSPRELCTAYTWCRDTILSAVQRPLPSARRRGARDRWGGPSGTCCAWRSVGTAGTSCRHVSRRCKRRRVLTYNPLAHVLTCSIEPRPRRAGGVV